MQNYSFFGGQPVNNTILKKSQRPFLLVLTFLLFASFSSHATSRTYADIEVPYTQHTLPVVTLETDSAWEFENLYYSQDKTRRILATFSYHDPNENLASQKCEIGLKGYTSLSLPKKSLIVDFKKEYGGDFQYNLYNNGIDSFGALALRAGQNYNASLIKNDFCLDICRNATEQVYCASTRWVVLYINGEYWGVYALEEDNTRRFYADHAGVSKKSVESEKAPFPLNGLFWDNIVLAKGADMGLPQNYEAFCRQVNIDSLIDWFLLEGYCANTDTQGNLKVFRSAENGNRWDFCFYDLDWTFGWTGGSFLGYLNYINNSGADMPPIIISLLNNSDFRSRLFTRYAELCDGPLSNESVLTVLARHRAELDPEMERDCIRWNLSYESWQLYMNHLENYIRGYDWCNFTKDQLMLACGASREEQIKYFGREAIRTSADQFNLE